MPRPPARILCRAGLAAIVLLFTPLLRAEEGMRVFNVKDYGATGSKADDAQKAIQSAVEACAKAGGGTVYVPAGEYTSGTIHLRNHVRFYIDAGATLYASTNPAVYDRPALLYAEDSHNITIEGRGTVEGQAQYVWQKNDQHYVDIEINRILAQQWSDRHGKQLTRPYPKGQPNQEYPHMIQLRRCQDVRIAGLSFLHSPSWTINPYGCERLVIDGVYIYTNPYEAVWADGIDPDGCKDVRIMNCTIETGDDSIVFYSMNWYGPALPCENITITNCRLTSASAALKFCDGNINCVRNVTVDNCVITGSNRGIAFMVYDGGYVENVILSNLVINCHRFDWFWWGDGDPIYFTIQRRSESNHEADKPGEPPAGSIRHVIIRNVIAHGQGTCLITGHPKSWLDDVSIENLRLFISTNPDSPYDKSVHAMFFQYAKNLKVKDVEVNWEKPAWEKWQSALYFENVDGLQVDGFLGGSAKPQSTTPAVVLNKVEDAAICNSRARAGTQVFLGVKGPTSRKIYLVSNELHDAAKPFVVEANVPPGTVKASNNF
jgi:hypothetical protein